jgi:hypothetical protein
MNREMILGDPTMAQEQKSSGIDSFALVVSLHKNIPSTSCPYRFALWQGFWTNFWSTLSLLLKCMLKHLFLLDEYNKLVQNDAEKEI